jgi:signal-transduction protein with cAMP-binding, CBS, and nucleotidyltransferase domain
LRRTIRREPASKQIPALKGSKSIAPPGQIVKNFYLQEPQNWWINISSQKPMKTSYPITSILHQKTPVLWSVAPHSTVFDAIKLMAAKNIGALLVLSGPKLVGVFTERDYTRKIALHGKNSHVTHVWEILPKEIISVTPEHSVEDCMRLMTENRVRHLPVLEGEYVVGIISIGDLVNWIISTQNAAIEQMEQYIAGGVAA